MHSALSRRHAGRGVALVLVLGCVVLLSVLIVAFLTSVKIEMASSASYANSTDVKQRSQFAVNMVIAQIQSAASGTNVAWISQPGLIRAFASSGTAAYKLYSSASMVEGGTFDPNAGSDVPADWKSRPEEFTDLNQPVLVPDPNGAISRDGLTYTPNFPILDPGAIGTVKGFAIDGNSTTPPDYASVDPITNNPAPMPVQWLYILQDGSVRAMSGGTVSGATRENPIVSRIAFWTDDETCKVNINTAAGDEWGDTINPGSFMDAPRARNDFESKLKVSQPVLHEYQRYPGHPATTYLSAVFPWLTRANIGEIVPKVSAGGSQGGTANTYLAGTGTALPMSDGVPLYASVDELRFVRSTATRASQDAALFTPRQIETSKFFLTAHSRAPEVNLFNKPRVSLWPQLSGTNNRTAFDKTMAFCSTIAGQPWYFVRGDPVSPTADYADQPRNQEIYAYLQGLTTQNVPGFGGNFLAKYPSPGGGRPSERDQILTEIFDYTRSQINLIDSGTGASAYAGPRVSNMKNHTTGGPGQVIPIRIGSTMGFGRTSTLYEAILHIIALDTIVDPNALAFYDKKTGSPPTGDNILRGKPNAGRPHENADLARLLTTRLQVALLFNTYSVSQGPVRFVPNLIFEVSGLDSLRVAGQSVDFGGGTASTSFGRWAPNHEYAWGSVSGPASLFWRRGGALTDKKTLGTGAPSTHYPFVSQPIVLGSGVEAKSPLSLESGEMELRIYAANADGTKGALVQTIPLSFPATTFPTPFVRTSYVRTYNGTGPDYNDDPTVQTRTGATYNTSLDSGSFPFSAGGGTAYGYTEGDRPNALIRSATRSLGAGGVLGDIRLVAASHQVPATAFAPLPGFFGQSAPIPPPRPLAPGAPPAPTYDYGFQYRLSQDTDPSAPKSDGMISGSERMGNSGGRVVYAGSLVAGADYDRHKNAVDANFAPAVSWGTTGAVLTGRDGAPALGDWDNGMGTIPDGAYINKADEGEMGSHAYVGHDYATSNDTLFSPNRQVPSPVVLGSLSTGVVRQLPWQTLLFCPNPAAKSQHPGLASPPDHLLLDLFTMPVVEPYAVSEPFSTAGKINLNAQIVPFTNVERTTGLQAVLRSVRLAAIPTADARIYKSGTAPNTSPYRIPLDLRETLKGFQDRFTSNRPFRSASEICEMFLVPQGKGATAANIEAWWDDYKLTGDNLRENPYSLLYSRLTTKSNTYTVHVRAQALKKVDQSNPGQWTEGKDKIVAEHRGSYTIERYLDPNLEIYDPAQPLTAYKFRTLSTKHFTP